MRPAGSNPGRLSRLSVWLFVLIVLWSIGGLVVWSFQQESARRTAEVRADAAETQVALLRAELADLTSTQAVASATAAAEANAPAVALQRALAMVFEAYKDPIEPKLTVLRDVLSPSAMAFARPEAEHLVSGGMHLGGESRYEVEILSQTQTSPETVEFRTRENWTYDELDAQNRRLRCVREQSEQIYLLRRTNTGAWMVDDIDLSGTTRRNEC
jgi:hypothetical protein